MIYARQNVRVTPSRAFWWQHRRLHRRRMRTGSLWPEIGDIAALKWHREQCDSIPSDYMQRPLPPIWFQAVWHHLELGIETRKSLLIRSIDGWCVRFLLAFESSVIVSLESDFPRITEVFFRIVSIANLFLMYVLWFSVSWRFQAISNRLQFYRIATK